MPVAPRKLPHKIEPTKVYPCPCCYQGQLRLILLTEALGCNRCQHIFAIMPDHLHIEQLAVSYPYRKLWFWNGSQWVLEREESNQNPAIVGMAIGMIALIVVCFIVASRMPGATELLSWLAIVIVFLIGLFLAVLILRRP